MVIRLLFGSRGIAVGRVLGVFLGVVLQIIKLGHAASRFRVRELTATVYLLAARPNG
jgi:hypothetical protein